MLTILGLGPGPWQQITPEARQVLEQSRQLYLRTSTHLAARSLPANVHAADFDHLYEELPDPESVRQAVVAQVVALTQRETEVTYAVPGSPLVGEATVPAIIGRCRDLGLPVRVISGIDIADTVLPSLGLDLPPPGLQKVDAHRARLDPALPALVTQVFNPKVLRHLEQQLESFYPPEHPAIVVPLIAGAAQEMKLGQLDPATASYPCCLYLPPLAEAERLSEFGTLVSIMARLRGPSGCPWDRQQSHASLRPNLLEECYEVLEALDEADASKLAEELGDLLMQIVLHSQIAAERGEFQMSNVLCSINAKLLRRHPHVFGQASVRDAEQVALEWEHIKRMERGDQGALLAGIPRELPALAASQCIQRRVARVGFDWKEIGGVLDKLAEEVAELTSAQDPGQREMEMGDIVFSLANMGRWLGVDMEAALRRANHRFSRRFAYMEAVCRQQGRSLADLSLDQQNELWEEAKRAIMEE